MAMINCKECGGEISSKADVCPKCGFRLKYEPSGCIIGISKIIGAIVGLVVFLLVLGALGNQ